MNLFVLFGQTATGKTSKALELVDQYNGEIINFDSRQIYKKLDIVTGKDRPTDPKYKIWLYDLVDPKDAYSSAEYVHVAEQTLGEVISRGKTPILVGGTGFYLYHLLYGTPQISVPENWPLRKELGNKSVIELTELLKQKNSALFDEMNESDRMNPRRLIRRIEIAYAGGSLAPKATTVTLPSRLANLGGLQGEVEIKYVPFFHTDSEKTREIIRARIMARLDAGAIEETQRLLSEGYKPTDPGLNAIGYQQIISYINDECTKEQMIELWLTREIQYAKRQKTFFKKYFTL
ncbi:MAG: tRNA (adenosine(37)-N6)-dimethylallyltransferase MiaA [Microgenomates group bacterium]